MVERSAVNWWRSDVPHTHASIPRQPSPGWSVWSCRRLPSFTRSTAVRDECIRTRRRYNLRHRFGRRWRRRNSGLVVENRTTKYCIDPPLVQRWLETFKKRWWCFYFWIAQSQNEPILIILVGRILEEIWRVIMNYFIYYTDVKFLKDSTYQKLSVQFD